MGPVNSALKVSGVASIGARGGRVPSLTVKKIVKNQEKRRKKRGNIRKKLRKRGKIGKKSQKIRKGYFTLPLLTNRAGYATAQGPILDIHSQWQGFSTGDPKSGPPTRLVWPFDHLRNTQKYIGKAQKVVFIWPSSIYF